MYTVEYATDVAGDVQLLSKPVRTVIKKAIEQKLTTAPEIFGKPLRHSLVGFRSLRVGNYRVVYLIKLKKALIFLIAHRSVVYTSAEKRVKKST